MFESGILGIIFGAQIVALVLAVYWFRGSPWRLIILWIAVVSIVVGALRRTLLLAMVLQGHVSLPPGTRQDLVAAAVLTLLLLVGVVMMHLILRSLELTTAALRESEAYFRGMVEYLPGLVYRCLNDKTRTLLFASNAIESLTGYPADDFINNRRRSFASLIHEDDQPAVNSLQDKLVAREAYEVKYRIRHASDRIVWVQERGRGVFDEADNLVCLNGFISDITERVQAETLLQAQRDLALSLSHSAGLEQTLSLCMRTAMDISGMDAGGIYLVDQESGALSLACHMGLPEEFVESADYYRGNSANARLIQRGVPIYTRYGDNLLKTDSVGLKEGLHALAVVPVKQDEKVIACINVASHSLEDVPDLARAALETLAGQVGQIIAREQAQGILREREANLQTLFGSIRDMLFVLDMEGSIQRANPAVSAALGFTEKDLAGRQLRDLVSPRLMAEAEATALELIGGRRSTGTITLCAREGRELPVEVSLVTGDWNSSPAYFVVARDITERLQAEKMRLYLERQVQVAQKLESLGVLAGGVAHDFNNLLTIILGNAELVRESLESENAMRKRLDVIMQTSRHASELCRQMMTYSGRGPLVTEVFYPHRLLREMLSLLKTAISKRVALKIEVPDELPPMKGDPSQMRQVMMNLSLNASEAIGEGNGEITIAMARTTRLAEDWTNAHLRPGEEAEEFIAMTVSDTGCGMDEETRKKIFDPFFSTKFTGRGLGMSAVLGIVSAHSGGIEVHSDPGSGTVFRLFFPVSHEIPAPVLQEAPTDYGTTSEGGAVLFVDDEDMLRDVAREAIMDEGLEPLLAANGVDAIEQYLQYGDAIRLVVLDMTMPVMNGEEAFMELKRIDPDVRVIVASGYSTSNFEQKFSGTQLAGVLHKPYSVAELRKTIRAVCAAGSRG